MIEAEFETIAERNTLLGSTIEEFILPTDTFSNPIILFAELNQATTNISTGSSLNIGWKSSKKSFGEDIFFFGISVNSGYLIFVSLNFQLRVLNRIIFSIIAGTSCLLSFDRQLLALGLPYEKCTK